MQHTIPRLLGLLGLLFFSASVFAGGGITAVLSNDALARCEAEAAIWEAWAPNRWTAQCEAGTASGYSSVHADYRPPDTCNRIGAFNVIRYYDGERVGIHSSSEPGYNSVAYCIESPGCEMAEGEGGIVTSYEPLGTAWPLNDLNPSDYICQNDCKYVRDGPIGGPGGDCYYEGAPGGYPADGDPWGCNYGYYNMGVDCDGGEDSSAGVPGGSGSCANTDCGEDSVPGDPGGSDPGGGLPPDDTNPGGSSGGPPGGASGGSDGDPDTAGGPGQGDGDVDGDGDRDVDCNPQSNPDCLYTGDGQGSGDCDTQPTCAGDPVQCAQLYQQWAIMCYDGDSFTNPGNCAAGFECDGDKLLCEIIRQQREQYCLLYHGDGSEDLNVFNDANFDRDLKEEAEIIDLPSSFDTSGWYGGGSCPSPFPFDVFGNSYTISVQAWCDLAPTIRVFVILAAILSGVYILMGRVD